ncbi:glycosyl transferase family 90, partial [Vibrio parahaemolyticus]
ILSLEGMDVATNLKWIMSSNSLCFTPKLRYETWFMEGKLKAGVHFVQVKDDFSDLDEKMDYYLEHPDKAEEIIQ